MVLALEHYSDLRGVERAGWGGSVLPCEKNINFIGLSPGVQDVNLTIFSHQGMCCSRTYPYFPDKRAWNFMFYDSTIHGLCLVNLLLFTVN